MRRILSFPILILSLGILAVALLLPGLASAEPLTIATGKAGGGYDRRAIQIERRLEQRGIAVPRSVADGDRQRFASITAAAQ